VLRRRISYMRFLTLLREPLPGTTTASRRLYERGRHAEGLTSAQWRVLATGAGRITDGGARRAGGLHCQSIALTAIRVHLGAWAGELGWMVRAYTLGFAVLMPAAAAGTGSASGGCSRPGWGGSRPRSPGPGRVVAAIPAGSAAARSGAAR